MNFDEKKIRDASSKSDSRIDLWKQVLNIQRVGTMLEIGVWKGDFAEEMLLACEEIERYYMIDPWANLPDWNKPFNVAPEMFDEIYQEALRKTGFAAEKVVVLRGRTKEVVDQIPDQSLDFAYIDGDHTLRGITIDLMKVLPKIKDGGIIGGDDFINTPWQHGVSYEPTLVCPYSIYFAEAVDLPIMALPHNQFMIRKDKASKFSFIDTTGDYKDISLNKLPIESQSEKSRPKKHSVYSRLARIFGGE